jgi:hypothetical protein
MQALGVYKFNLISAQCDEAGTFLAINSIDFKELYDYFFNSFIAS